MQDLHLRPDRASPSPVAPNTSKTSSEISAVSQDLANVSRALDALQQSSGTSVRVTVSPPLYGEGDEDNPLIVVEVGQIQFFRRGLKDLLVSRVDELKQQIAALVQKL